MKSEKTAIGLGITTQVRKKRTKKAFECFFLAR